MLGDNLGPKRALSPKFWFSSGPGGDSGGLLKVASHGFCPVGGLLTLGCLVMNPLSPNFPAFKIPWPSFVCCLMDLGLFDSSSGILAALKE